jgi:hypothetical protein
MVSRRKAVSVISFSMPRLRNYFHHVSGLPKSTRFVSGLLRAYIALEEGRYLFLYNLGFSQ